MPDKDQQVNSWSKGFPALGMKAEKKHTDPIQRSV